MGSLTSYIHLAIFIHPYHTDMIPFFTDVKEPENSNG